MTQNDLRFRGFIRIQRLQALRISQFLLRPPVQALRAPVAVDTIGPSDRKQAVFGQISMISQGMRPMQTGVIVVVAEQDPVLRRVIVSQMPLVLMPKTKVSQLNRLRHPNQFFLKSIQVTVYIADK